MKKIHGITLGGLQQKTVRIMLIMLIVTIAMFVGVAAYQRRMLAQIVEDSREEQQQSVLQISEKSVDQLLEHSLVRTTGLQAEMADNGFAEIVNYIYMMKAMAEGLFGNKDVIEPAKVDLPDPAKDGTATAHALFEEGVDYTKSEYLGIIGHMSDPLLAMYRNNAKIESCYVGLEDGTHLSIDEHSANRFDENGNQIPYPVRQRPWYRGAVEAGGLYFTGLEKDAFSGVASITCAAPFYSDGVLRGVVGADIRLDTMNDLVSSSSEEDGWFFIINDRGQVLLAGEDNGIFEAETADEAKDLRELGNEELAAFINQALKEKTHLTTVSIDGTEYYMAGAPMPTIGWAAVMMVRKELTEAPARQTLEELNKINDNAAGVFRERAADTTRTAVLMIVAILALGISWALTGATRIVRPVEEMTRNIMESARTGKLFEMKDSYRTDDEIQVLAEAFDDLSKKTKQYIEDITTITREKERISTELDLARKIQADMLPYIYPAFPDRPEFDIYATMNPAREVGGDFYDFFLIDKDHLGMVVADVSGKGVPAALFMMMAKILINNFAMLGGSPAEVLEQTNTAICQNNEEDMFVTAWFGILEISTGRVIAANAGHEHPILRQPGGSFEVFKDKHGFVLGGLEGMEYENYEIRLKKGGMLFLYTDGVPESTNEKRELFGLKRLLVAMNESNAEGPVELLKAVRESVNEFIGDADPFDDLTMLGITLLKGPEETDSDT